MTFPSQYIPPHDPNRFLTTDGFDDSQRTNGMRAEDAAMHTSAVLRDDSDYADLICNILHLAHSQGRDHNSIISTSLGAFFAESGPIPA